MILDTNLGTDLRVIIDFLYVIGQLEVSLWAELYY